MQRDLESNMMGTAGLGLVDAGSIPKHMQLPHTQPTCFLQPINPAELKQPEPGGAVIMHAKHLSTAPNVESAVHGGDIYARHMESMKQSGQPGGSQVQNLDPDSLPQPVLELPAEMPPHNLLEIDASPTGEGEDALSGRLEDADADAPPPPATWMPPAAPPAPPAPAPPGAAEPAAASQPPLLAAQPSGDAGHWFQPGMAGMTPHGMLPAAGATEPGDFEKPRRGGSIFSSCAGATPFQTMSRSASGCALMASASVEQAVGAAGASATLANAFGGGAGSLQAGAAGSCAAAAPAPPPQMQPLGTPADSEQQQQQQQQHPASLLASLQQPTPPPLPDSAFRLIMDQLPSAVFVKDAVGNVIYSNRVAQHAIGLAGGHDAAIASSILGWQIAPLMPVEQLPLQLFHMSDVLPPLPPARAMRVSLMDQMCIARGELPMFHMPFFFNADGPPGSNMRQAAALFIEQQQAPSGPPPLSHQ